jgi:hypothetical protein
MQTRLPQLKSPVRPSRRQPNICAPFVLASLFALAFAAAAIPAQTPAPVPVPANTPTPHKAHPHKRSAAVPAQPVLPPVAPAPATPPAPVVPQWPVNEKPEDATVTWDSRGLSINASNSSLQQIMTEVATTTGAKIEGIDKDERIFGAYGPGQPREVLSQLLEGSGYNILMIGDQGHGAPRQILLTARRSGDTPGARPAATPVADEEVEVDDTSQQPQQPVNQPFRPSFQPGQPGQPRTNPQIPGQQQQQPPPPPPQPGQPPPNQ